MWKKLCMMFGVLALTVTAGYAYFNHEMNAASSYSAGGNLTGRVNLNPSNLSVSQSGMQKGDRVLMGTINPFDNQPLAWILSNYINGYTDYDDNGCTTTWTNVCTTTSPKSGWFVQSDRKIAYMLSGLTTADFVKGKYDAIGYPTWLYVTYGQTKIADEVNKLNSAIKSNVRDDALLIERDLGFLATKKNICDTPGVGDTSACDRIIYTPFYINNETGRKVFTIAESERSDSDKSFSELYFSSAFLYSAPYSIMYVNYAYGGSSNNFSMVSINDNLALRPSAYFDLSNVVFAVSQGNGSGIGSVTQSTLTGFPNVYSAAISSEPMKLRMYNSSMTAQLNDIKNANGKSITKVAKDGTVKLSANVNSGNDKYGGVYTISVLVFDQNNNFVAYKPIGSAQGSKDYEFDTTGLTVGKYKIAIVNEAYKESDTSPADSSFISDTKPLEIVELHEIQYTKTPGSGATKGDYEYSKNVNAGQAIGKITLNPTGVTPITYEIISNGDNSYQNFEIDGLDSNNASSATSLNVKIKTSAPDLDNGGLKAGTYKFCITSTDDNGYPDKQIEGKTKVCTSFTVEKTKPTIEFDVKTDTTKTVTEAATPWNETATGNPTHGTKITYTIVGGDIGLIDFDKDTAKVTYKGNGAFGKVKIRATIDDDPSTGNDNYESAYTEKEIIIAQEVDGIVTPDSASSDTTIPTFKANDANVKIGGSIGVIKGTKGTPDTIGGTTTTYQYVIKSGGNGSFFQVDSKTGVIKSDANLAVGTYKFTITVSDKWTSKDVEVTVNVGVATAEDLKFYENKTSNTVINKKEVEFTDTNVSVYATVKGSQNNNPVTYKIKDGSTNVITINSSTGAITIKGVGTVTIVAEKKGASGQADASTELTFTVKAVEQEFIYTTDSTFSKERPKTNGYYDALKETYAPNKTFYVYTTGNPKGSTVTYQLSADSPQDVISVDSDGKIHILNASLKTQIGKVKVEATSHDPSGNYTDKTIVLPVDIEQGERKVSFKENPINVLSDKNGSVTPDILVDGVLDTESDPAKKPIIEVDQGQGSVAWTNDGETVQYSWEDKKGKDINLTVTKPADRNYKEATGKGVLHILGADENSLTLSTPGKVIYGDHFVIRSTQNDGSSTNVQYKFETDNGVYISAPDVTGNKAEFDALAYSGSTIINIKVTRTADGEIPLTKTVQIQVLPKPIEIVIEDKEKKRLEENPPLTYKDFTSQLVSWNGVTDTIDTTHIKLTTTAKKISPVGTYPIIAKNAQEQLNKNYPNYTFTIKEGKLNIKDNGNKDFWDIDDDGCPDLNIIITDDNGDTILINGDKDEDGIPDYNIDINGDGKPDLNIDTDDDGKPDLNLVMLKSWKPSKCVTVNAVEYSSGITAKAEINVDLDEDGIPDINIDNKGDFKPHLNISKDGKKPSVNITTIHDWKPGKDYKKGAWEYDSIGDDIKPELNIDTDDDGLPDINLDFDGDGIPDLNIDVDGDWIPDMDIDSTGDGKPDVNVDTDGDGEPDENIKEIIEWKPEHNVKEPFGYDTMRFDEPDDEELDDKPNTEVNGSYYPGANMGGALTGDHTNIIMYIGFGSISSLAIIFVLHKQKDN